MMDIPHTEEVEAFLEMVDLDELRRASDDTACGTSESAFCIACGDEYDDGEFRLTPGSSCTACGQEAVYPVENVIAYCEEYGLA